MSTDNPQNEIFDFTSNEENTQREKNATANTPAETLHEPSAVEQFFTMLAQRQNGHENDLSDLTWAMCQASNAFKAAFVRFFFPSLDPATVESIEREVTYNDARPDFVLTCQDGTQFLVEVKIWNRDQHFGQYDKAFNIPSERLGYIVNYELHMDKYTVHTWEEFYKYLADKAPAEECDVWAGYRAYVKETCWIFDRITPLRPHDKDFTDTIIRLFSQAITSIDEENVKCWLYGNRNHNLITNGNVGCEFQLRRTDVTQNDIWGAFIVYDYDKDHPCIYIAFKNEDNWGREFTRHFDTDEKASKFSHNNVSAFWESNALWIELDPTEFFACPTIEGQEKILHNFLYNTLTTPFEP